jgi:predicted negative regulator of RcsB-dependent stress response
MGANSPARRIQTSGALIHGADRAHDRTAAASTGGAMGKYKVSRKQLLKEPDEFITFSGKIISFLRTHRQPIIFCAAAFVVILVSIAGYRYMSARWENEASAAVHNTIAVYEQAQADGKTPAQALTAVEADLKDVLNRYDGQAAGQAGRLFYADALLAADRPGEAIDRYKAALGDYEAGTYLYYRILESLAQAHLAQKQYLAATDVLRKVADGTGEGMADAALFQLGLAFEAAGDTARGDAAFQSLKEKYPDSQYVDIAASRRRAG